MKKIGFFIQALLIGGFMTGCSTTTFKTPDYYNSKLVPKQYLAGKNIIVNDLKCSKNESKCKKVDKNWKTHKEYKKNYYFE